MMKKLGQSFFCASVCLASAIPAALAAGMDGAGPQDLPLMEITEPPLQVPRGELEKPRVLTLVGPLADVREQAWRWIRERGDVTIISLEEHEDALAIGEGVTIITILYQSREERPKR